MFASFRAGNCFFYQSLDGSRESLLKQNYGEHAGNDIVQVQFALARKCSTGRLTLVEHARLWIYVVKIHVEGVLSLPIWDLCREDSRRGMCSPCPSGIYVVKIHVEGCALPAHLGCSLRAPLREVVAAGIDSCNASIISVSMKHGPRARGPRRAGDWLSRWTQRAQTQLPVRVLLAPRREERTAGWKQ